MITRRYKRKKGVTVIITVRLFKDMFIISYREVVKEGK